MTKIEKHTLSMSLRMRCVSTINVFLRTPAIASHLNFTLNYFVTRQALLVTSAWNADVGHVSHCGGHNQPLLVWVEAIHVHYDAKALNECSTIVVHGMATSWCTSTTASKQ